MKISLDYDETYTRDPKLWDAFVRMASARGHEVICVTMRFPSAPTEFPADLPITTVYTSHKAKLEFMRERGIWIDIWIDDSPHWILESAASASPLTETEAAA